MTNTYYSSIILIEKLHRLFLDVLQNELRLMDVKDITNVQCTILYNIGEDEINVSSLTDKGYYQGSNVSYNLRKMVENGYVLQQQAVTDKRVTLISLTGKGMDLRDKLHGVFGKHIKEIDVYLNEESLRRTLSNLCLLEMFLINELGINKKLNMQNNGYRWEPPQFNNSDYRKSL